MLMRKPDYYDSFQCLMGACPDTCCAAWDIVIDEDSAAFYRSLPGELGERIRAAMVTDGDGDLCFCVEGGHCPLLTGDGLCSIQLEFGEERVCDTCRSHPRFIEEYGWFKEAALAASCPAALDLILSRDPILTETEVDEEDFVCEDVDEELLRALLPCRDRAFALLDRADLSWKERLAALLSFGSELQVALLTDGPDALPVLAETWANVDADRRPFPAPEEGTILALRRRLVSLLDELEVLDESWSRDVAALPAPTDEKARPCDEIREQRWVKYLIWRWFLRADFDGDLYSKLSLPVLSVLTLRELSGGENWPDWARRWAKETEHSSENLNALYDALCAEEALSPGRLIAAL